METRARYVLIGAFTVLGFLAMLVFLLWFGKSQSDRQFAYYDVLFDNVSGISRGADVRFAGLSVGQVTALNLDRENPAKVRVRLEVDARAPVKTDSTTTLEQQGVTGLAAVSIAAGSPGAPLARDVTDGVPTLPSGRSTLQSLTEDAPQLISEALDAMSKVNAMLSDENQQKIQGILDNVEDGSEQLKTAIGGLDETMNNISGAVSALSGIKDELSPLSERAAKVLDSADAAIADIRGLKDQAGGVLDSGQKAMTSASDAIENDLRPALADLEKSSASLRELMDKLGPQADGLISTWTTTGERLTARVDQAEGLITSVKKTADAFDAETMGKVNKALDRLANDLPQITGDLRQAARNASDAFTGLGQLANDSRKPVADFLRSGLPQFTQLAGEARRLVQSLETTATRMGRNPAGTLLNTDKPEFRR